MKLKTVIQPFVTAVLGIVLFAGAPVANATPFPKRGYTLSVDGEGVVQSSIGRRASVDSAQRAALRMLSRLVRCYPQRYKFNVVWKTLGKNGQVQEDGAFFNYYAATDGADLIAQCISLVNKRYVGVTKTILHATAKHNGTFRDLTRYDVVDYMSSIRIDLGTRASYGDGSRATMRVLAQRLRSPFHAIYEFKWQYHRADVDPDRRVGQATVSYHPNWENSLSLDLDTSGSSSVSWAHDADKSLEFKGVSKKAIFAVAHQSGAIEDLMKMRPKIYRIKK